MGSRLMKRFGTCVAVSALCGSMLTLVVGVATPMSAQASSSKTYYVSLGDSYSVGYQPNTSKPQTGHASNGYTVPVSKAVKMTLVNFGCSGATTTSILDTIGCPAVLPNTAGGQKYPTQTQIAAADAFISGHKGHIGLITVSISGNDVTACVKQATPIPCVAAATASITENVATLATDLRAAAGPNVPLVGLTYPDVVLGTYVYPQNPGTIAAKALAGLSVTAFKSLINPALSVAYGNAQGVLVDVTKGEGSYVSLDKTVKTKTYGTIPVAVGSICTLTWYCKYGNIHQKTPGYSLEAVLIVKQYASMMKSMKMNG